MSDSVERILIVDLVGYDRRRIDVRHTPFSHRLFETHPYQRMRGQPTTEVWPSIVCGVNPGVEGHLLWHARLKDRVEDHALGRLIDKLPDWLVTTCQLVPFLFLGHRYDVPAMPRWRRHQLEFHRLKYNIRWQEKEKYHVVGGARTMFHAMGEDATYRVADKFEELDEMARLFPTRHRLQMLEIHAFDLLSHWYLDRPEVIHRHMSMLDRCAERLYEKCRQEGVTFVLLIEHGQEAVRKEDHIDLQRAVHATGVRREELCYYTGVAVARFWFKTERARELVTGAVGRLPHVRVMTWLEMNEAFDFTLTPEWGELYVICEPGHLFHPHDYYHPLGNLFVGLTQKAMRRRMFDPYHRGYHGHLPGAPADDGYVIIPEPHVEPIGREARLMDFAPSMLHLLGRPTPPYMSGRPTWRVVGDAPASSTVRESAASE